MISDPSNYDEQDPTPKHEPEDSELELETAERAVGRAVPAIPADEPDSEPEPKTLDELAEELGPFVPPEDYVFEEEFTTEIPRPVPPYLRQGFWQQRWRAGLITSAVVASFLLALAQIEQVNKLGYYILPLAWLDWIGWGLLALTALIAIWHYSRPGKYHYIKKGLPFIARILRIGREIIQNKDAVDEFRFALAIDYLHPHTGKTCTSFTFSENLGSFSKAYRYQLTCQPGDYVTAVALPDKFDTTVEIYGLMGLNPDLDFITKDGKTRQCLISLPKIFAVILGIIGALALLVMGLYAIEFYSPLKYTFFPFLVAAVVCGFLGGVVSWIATRNCQPKTKLLAINLSLFGAAFAGLIMVPFINALMDTSEPEYREVEIMNFWQTTNDYFIRTYDIEYQMFDDRSDTHNYPTNPDEIEKYEFTMHGAIEMHQGYFSMPWIKQLHPAILVSVEPNEPLPHARTVSFDDDPEKVTVIPLIELSESNYFEPSDPFCQSVWETLEQYDFVKVEAVPVNDPNTVD